MGLEGIVSKRKAAPYIAVNCGATPHVAFAFLGPGDVSIIPDPAYQAYLSGTLLSDATPYVYALRPRTNFLIDLDEIPRVRAESPLLSDLRVRLPYLLEGLSGRRMGFMTLGLVQSDPVHSAIGLALILAGFPAFWLWRRLAPAP